MDLDKLELKLQELFRHALQLRYNETKQLPAVLLAQIARNLVAENLPMGKAHE